VAVPSREDAVRILDDGHGQIHSLVERLTEQDFERTATIGGGDWSARDLVGHLTTWEEVAIEALEEWRAGTVPSAETDIFEIDGGIDAFNARTVEGKRRLSGPRVRQASQRAHATLVAEIEAMSDAEWHSPAPYVGARRRHLSELLGSILGAPKRPFGHAFAHLGDLQAFVESLDQPP